MIVANKWLHVLILWVLFFCTTLITLKCVRDEDCYSHGICANGTCACFEGWQDPDCQFCGGKIKLTNVTGSITDGIGNYSFGLKCTWLIESQSNETISLFFNEFATECNWDYLYVYDGDNVNDPLVAAFNGIMFRNHYQIRRVPEIVLRSGYGLLHFSSDDAYNMTGFDIRYRFNKCPSTTLETECSNHGACTSGYDCTCSAQWTGTACHVPLCYNNCTNHGVCNHEKHYCICDTGYGGTDCSQVQKYGFWQSIDNSHFVPATSHSSEVWLKYLIVIGGYNFAYHNRLHHQYLPLYIYNMETNYWKKIDGESSQTLTPLARYNHASSIIDNKLYIYGGVVINKNGEFPTNEFLVFDLETRIWSSINITNCNRCVSPFRLLGHTMNVFEKKLIVIFGFSPDFGYLNLVQQYDPDTRQWAIVTTKGFPVKGTYGHSTVYDSWSKKFYVYGGLVVSMESNQKLSNRIYSYEPISKTWILLSLSPSARYFHSSVFLSPGLMMVFGGSTHNDTSHNFGSKCYSSDSLVYDTMCDTWYYLRTPSNDLVQSDVARFGHSAITYNQSVYIYGGFNGIVLNDLIQFTMGDCRQFENQNECLNSRPGVKCVWNLIESECVPVTDNDQFDKMMYTLDRQFVFCAEQNRSLKTLNILSDKEQCAKLTDCLSCTETSRKCVWCRNDVCSYEKCRDQYQPNSECHRSQDDNNPYCNQLISCKTCEFNKKCFWAHKENKCYKVDVSPVENYAQTADCDSPCAEYNSCSNCTQDKCIWCQNENRCVDKNAYMISFPYGQCREWTASSIKCRLEDDSNKNSNLTIIDECIFYKSCKHCLSNPACGWCDDGSNTGLGKCMSGGSNSPNAIDLFHKCPNDLWFFTSCPNCQCNGHSDCLANTSTCRQPCTNLTIGDHCDKCVTGYWGNPLNGGKCLPCDCNNRATFCHPDTGKCFCSMKGLTGDHCDKCDFTNHYHEDGHKKGVCYYDLTIDYQFTFNLSKKEDRFYTQINFRNSPIKPDIDADFQITCSVLAKINITIRQPNSDEKVFFSGQNCTSFRYRFTKSDYLFGLGENVTLTTFYVYVYDFQSPLWIQISFSQYPKLNLQQFFITFTTCFLLLLMVAVVLWRIKQKFDMYRRRQRLFVEMEQMASRPFAQIYLDTTCTSTEVKSKTPTNPVALEPCDGNKTAVLTILVRLPTGGGQYTQPGQSAGLAIACTLVNLSQNARKNSFDSLVVHKLHRNSKRFKKKYHPRNQSQPQV